MNISLVCLGDLEQAVSFFTIKCQLRPIFLRSKKSMRDSEKLQGISMYNACHIILVVARSCAQSCLDYHIYKWLKSCIAICCTGFEFQRSSTISKTLPIAVTLGFFYALMLSNINSTSSDE